MGPSKKDADERALSAFNDIKKLLKSLEIKDAGKKDGSKE